MASSSSLPKSLFEISLSDEFNTGLAIPEEDIAGSVDNDFNWRMSLVGCLLRQDLWISLQCSKLLLPFGNQVRVLI